MCLEVTLVLVLPFAGILSQSVGFVDGFFRPVKAFNEIPFIFAFVSFALGADPGKYFL